MQDLLTVLSKVSRTPVEKIELSSSLRTLGLSQSMGLQILRSALERQFSRSIPPLSWQLTVKDLEALVKGEGATLSPALEAEPASPEPPTFPPMNAGPFGVGIDMEEISNLPDGNLREEAFYQRHFTEREISTALLRPDPKAHLCGIFCAKEALRKAHPDLLDLDFAEIEVQHDRGRPVMSIHRPTLSHRFVVQISITHTKSYASAAAFVLEGN